MFLCTRMLQNPLSPIAPHILRAVYPTGNAFCTQLSPSTAQPTSQKFWKVSFQLNSEQLQSVLQFGE